MLKFREFSEKYIEESVYLALREYEEECSIVNELPKSDYYEIIYNLLKGMIDHNLGSVVIDNNKVIGFITCYAPINNFFGNVKGAFSPIHGHAAMKENRSYIYSKLYQHVADKWVSNGILSHGISVYAHNNTAIEGFFHNGFGLRCVDAISMIEDLCLEMNTTNITMEEITIDKINCLFELNNNLALHFIKSPTFFPKSIYSKQEFEKKALDRKSRFFIAKDTNKVIGFIEIADSGENFTCDDKKTVNICGAYLSEEYRGGGIFRDLLSYTATILHEEKYHRCGVDFESINPTANRFWRKYFKPYTYSMVRRIDERVLNTRN